MKKEVLRVDCLPPGRSGVRRREIVIEKAFKESCCNGAFFRAAADNRTCVAILTDNRDLQNANAEMDSIFKVFRRSASLRPDVMELYFLNPDDFNKRFSSRILEELNSSTAKWRPVSFGALKQEINITLNHVSGSENLDHGFMIQLRQHCWQKPDPAENTDEEINIVTETGLEPYWHHHRLVFTRPLSPIGSLIATEHGSIAIASSYDDDFFRYSTKTAVTAGQGTYRIDSSVIHCVPPTLSPRNCVTVTPAYS